MAAAGPVAEELAWDRAQGQAHGAAQTKKGAWPEAVGSARGASRQAHALADPHGRPVALALTPGKVPDIPPDIAPDIALALPLPEGLPRPQRRIADTAYDALFAAP